MMKDTGTAGADMDEAEVIQAINKFLQEHPELHIHPSRTPESWAPLVIKAGGCPCVPGRPSCPCTDVMVDVEKKGYCRCQTFVDDKWMGWYRQYIKGRKNRKKATSEADPSPSPPLADPQQAQR